MAKKENWISITAQFFPVFIFLAYFLYPSKFLQFSNTFLGKLILLLFVILYSYIDKLVGTIAALLFIVYFQSDTVETFETLNYYLNYEGAIKTDPARKMISTSLGAEALKEQKESFISDSGAVSAAAAAAENDFINKKCVNGVLTSPSVMEDGDVVSIPVKTDMIEHVYPQIKFKRGACNPCDKTCEFSIANKKIEIEKEIVYPKNSNDFMNTVMTSSIATEITPASTMGVISETFSGIDFK